MALCLTTRQFAVGAQGFLNAQGLMHCLFSHAVKSGHSSLVEQPTSRLGSVGGGTRKKDMQSCSQTVTFNILNVLKQLNILKVISYKVCKL
jgi:hypothetical protein